MADSDKKVKLTLGVETEGSGKAVLDLDKIAKKYAEMADATGRVGSSLGLATIAANRLGATQDDVVKLRQLYVEYRKTIVGATKDTEELAKAQEDVTASAPDVTGAGASGGGGSSYGPGGNALQRAGSGLRSLPSVQIPGLGIGTDAVANIIRVSGAFSAMAETSATATAATKLLSLGLAEETAASIGALAPLGLFIAGFAAIGLALKQLTDSTSQQVDEINSFADAQRSLSDKIAAGLTSKDADKEAESIQQRRDSEVETLAKLQASYDEFERQAREAAEAQKPLIQGLFGARAGTEALANVAKLASADEQALADQIQKSKDLIEGYDASTQTLTQAQEDGTLAANDAADAEKKLAEERTKAVLDSAEAAGKELAAQQKALSATEEQNTKRLESIDNEKAVVQTQIDVLTASGDTSEEVTAKIAALTGQLGALGKESDFIKNTALEVSRAADAEKKAKKDAEDAAKKAEQAQEAYTKAVKSANLSYKNAVQDLGTRLGQALSDNTLKFNRDLDNIGTKFRQDQFDLEVKAYRAERDAQQDQLDDLANMRKDANKEEAQALQDGDFKALFLAREKNKETLAQEQTAIDQSAARRAQSLRDAQEDLLRSAQRQRAARVLSYEQQTTDIRTSSARDLQQASLTRKRALQIASEGQNAELAMRANFWNAAIAQTANAQQQMLKIMQGGAKGTGPNQSSSPYAGGFASSFTTAVRK